MMNGTTNGTNEIHMIIRIYLLKRAMIIVRKNDERRKEATSRGSPNRASFSSYALFCEHRFSKCPFPDPHLSSRSPNGTSYLTFASPLLPNPPIHARSSGNRRKEENGSLSFPGFPRDYASPLRNFNFGFEPFSSFPSSFALTFKEPFLILFSFQY